MSERSWTPVTYDAVCAIIQGRNMPYRFVNVDGYEISFANLNSEGDHHNGTLLLHSATMALCEVWRIWWGDDGFYRYERLI